MPTTPAEPQEGDACTYPSTDLLEPQKTCPGQLVPTGAGLACIVCGRQPEEPTT